MNTSSFLYIKIEKIKSLVRKKSLSIKNYFEILNSDGKYAANALIQLKKECIKKSSEEIESFNRTMLNMRNIVFIFSAYAMVIIIITLATNNYSDTFLENFLVNANSSILDFLILGVILYYFEHKRQNKEAVQELLEDLENLAKHSSAELNIMKIKIIRQLNSKGVFNINVQRIELTKLSVIKYLNFKNADLKSLNMSESYIRNCSFVDCEIQALNINGNRVKNVKFIKCNLKNIKATNAIFQNVEFDECNFSGGFFNHSNLKSCIMKNCDFKDVTYEKATLLSVNILGARNINTERMIEAENLDYIKCSDEIKIALKEKNPSIKFAKRRTEVRESNPIQ
ncbi:pentapeptide repeat-containing protein [Yersinia sp. 2540 StPb PI]|uniref:pentapeptide repeat-containing protein n=1 Tax=Yersinia sp. 2540 StPb PI TaxID=3117406 RepID=UPI003FA4B3C3